MYIQGTVVWLLFTGSMLGWPGYVSGMNMTAELFLAQLTSGWPCLTQILQVRVWTEFRRTCLCPCSSASASEGFGLVFQHNIVTWREGGLHIWWLTPVSMWAESASCWCFLVGAEVWDVFLILKLWTSLSFGTTEITLTPDGTLHNVLSSPVARFLKLCWLFCEQEVHVNTAQQAWGAVRRPWATKAAWAVPDQKEADRQRYNNNFNTYSFNNNFV